MGLGTSLVHLQRAARLPLSPTWRAARFALSHSDPLSPVESGRAAIEWLLSAFEACQRSGYSIKYDLLDGWDAPYVEVSGYIIPTLRRAARFYEYRELQAHESCDAAAQWLLGTQFPDGSFGDPVRGWSAVFDTGQVLFGLLDTWHSSGDDRFLLSALRAAQWMVGQLDDDGAWRHFAYQKRAHTYYTRAAWALALLGQECGEDSFVQGARSNLSWCTNQQSEDGWFSNCSFFADERPVLHVVAYTIEGLWESGLLLEDQTLLDAAWLAAQALASARLQSGGILSSHYATGWRASGRSHCLTGLAQMALCWKRMNARTPNPAFAEAASETLEYLRGHQFVVSRCPAINGGFSGSMPMGGEYFPWALPSWGAKFYLDALIAGDEPRAG